MRLQDGAELQNGKYRIIRLLGQGGFGITYLAEHTMLDKLVAIKEFFPKDFCDRNTSTNNLSIGTKNSIDLVEMLKGKFIKEARNISKLTHPNIITIHDIFQENETAYYVMEYIDGASLSEAIKTNGALDETTALSYIRKISEAVGLMHGLSMNHLDLKPANIMLRSSDNQPILIDFGLSKQYNASGDQTSTTPVGISQGYAPIEQYRPGGVATFTPQTDIYALGATLYALLSGTTPPHYSDILEDGLPKLPSAVSTQTMAAIEKAMETKKAKRPASIEAFLSLLPDTNPMPEVANQPQTHTPAPEFPNSSQDKAITDESIVNKVSDSDNSGMEVNRAEPISEGEKEKKIHREETVILLSNDTDIQDNAQVTKPDSSEIEYIDLGLSMKWASKIIGKASPSDIGSTFLFKLNDNTSLSPTAFMGHNYRLPTINHFEELIEKCTWNTFYSDGKRYYRIVGPNGNSIIMPIRDMKKFVTFQTLWPDALGFCYYFILGDYAPSISKAPRAEAFIWPVQK